MQMVASVDYRREHNIFFHEIHTIQFTHNYRECLAKSRMHINGIVKKHNLCQHVNSKNDFPSGHSQTQCGSLDVHTGVPGSRP